jgi:hypothetical protein
VMTSCLGQLRCEEWKFSHRLGGFARCVLNRGVRDAGMARIQSLGEDISYDAACIGNSSFPP